MTTQAEMDAVNCQIQAIKATLQPLHLEKARLGRKLYYEANSQAFKDRAEKRRKANPVQALKDRRKRYRAKHAHYLLKSREYAEKRIRLGKAAAYRESVRERQREWSRKRSKKAGDDYARELLAKNSPISSKDFPQSLVELKKLTIKIKRKLKSK